MSQSLHLPIQKYSYAANAPSAHHPSVRWNHLTGEGMAIVLENSAPGFALDEVSMKVVQEAGVLESIPLQRLCRRASDASKRGLTRDFNDLPIHGVIRCPRVAITYTTDNGQVRKFQVRVKHESDYEDLTRVLRDLHCSLRESPDRPNTAGTSISVPTRGGISDNTVPTPSVELSRPSSAAPSTSFNQKPSSASVLRPGTKQQQTSQVWACSEPAPRFNIHDRTQNLDVSSHKHYYNKPLALSQPGNSYSDRHHDLQTPESLRQPVFSSTAPQQPTFDLADSPEKSRHVSAPFPYALELASYTLPPRRELPFDNPVDSPSKELTMESNPGKSRLSSARRDEDATSAPKKVAKKRLGSSAATQTKKSAAPKKKQVSVTQGVAQLTEELDNPSLLTPLDPNASPASKRLKSKSTSMTKAASKVTNSQTATDVVSENEQIATLRAYASTPSRERQTIIDDTISMYIGDDSFVTLCEDVELSWRRIGFETNST